MPNLEGRGPTKIPMQWIVPLCPAGVTDEGLVTPCDYSEDRDRAAFFFQLFGTFIFVMVIMTVKGSNSGPTKDGTLGAATVALTLMSQIFVSA